METSQAVNVEQMNPTEIKPLPRARGVRPFGLYDLSLPNLRQKLIEFGQPGYRAKQVYDWTYSRLAGGYDEMTNLPADLRAKLHEALPLALLVPVREIATDNGDTIKTLYRTIDGQFVETVLMLYRDRATVCVSCQVGCAVGCAFCATGIGGLTRNLTAGEMVMQAVGAARRARGLGRQLTNLVMMGMGEPLQNYAPTMQMIGILHDPEGFNFGARRITISTSGIVPRILALANEPLQVNLAVSLHAPNDELRGQPVPINKRWPVADLMVAVETYTQTTHRRVSFEYALMGGINDSDEIAEELGQLLRKRLCHLNLIPYNPVDLLEFERPSPERIARFAEIVEAAGVPVTVRYSRGVEIAAACGQLRANQERASAPASSAT
jgi:23S rRNA (adenine2503-C2)-methyltransferase